MEIGITQTLAKKIKITSAPSPVQDDLFFCWDAHILKYGTRQCLMLTNARTRLTALMINLKPSDWKDFEATSCEAIRTAMDQCGCRDHEIERYFQSAGDLSLTKTHGRTTQGVMNLYGRTIDWLTDLMDPSERYQWECCRILHQDVFDAGEKDGRKIIYPSEYFLLCMEEHGLFEI